MYGIYVKDDDEMFVMSQDQVFKYLASKSMVFKNYGVHTDGKRVTVWETSAGANGKLSQQSVDEFFHSFDDEGWIIRKISDNNHLE
ncbi:hypothetical protein WMW72_35285 [Paenibacillus filicis]|uniref:Uncharacterized protein n=1 Tax=Paenibacillus filicis TaxID=669464 RepID=A0ABU9DY23_9BACL